MQVVIFSNSNVTGKPVLKFSIFELTHLILFLASSISLVSLALMPFRGISSVLVSTFRTTRF